MKLPMVLPGLDVEITTLKDMHEWAIEWAITGRELSGPMPCPIVAMQFGPTIQMFALQWEDDDEKDEVFWRAKNLVKEAKDIRFYSFMTEAWAAKVDPKDKEEMKKRPRDAKVRDDILLINSHQRGGHSLLTHFVVGKRTIGVRQDFDGDHVEGRAVGWFDEVH